MDWSNATVVVTNRRVESFVGASVASDRGMDVCRHTCGRVRPRCGDTCPW